jgi:tetratricopeptide (TPR) repeat protein
MFDQAILDYTNALKIDPTYAFAYSGRGAAYNNKKMYIQAIDDFTNALRINPNDTFARDNLELARRRGR